jgi:hypothetical protein
MTEADAEDSIPPEWVTLADLPRWVDRVHGVRTVAITRDLYLAVRSKREIKHRVACKPRDRTNSPSLPPGLVNEAWHGIRRVFVEDWEVAEADWKAATVGGWKQDDGTWERLPIEVPWEAVDHFMRISLQGWKREAAEARAAPDRDMSRTPQSSVTAVAGTGAAEKQMTVRWSNLDHLSGGISGHNDLHVRTRQCCVEG